MKVRDCKSCILTAVRPPQPSYVTWRSAEDDLRPGWTELAIVHSKDNKGHRNAMPVSCFGKSFIQSFRRIFQEKPPDKPDDNQSDDCSPSAGLPVVTQVAPQQAEDPWLRAEWQLKQNETTNKILTASVEILEIHFGLNVQTHGITGRELCGFLDTKTRELEEKKWVVRFGGHKLGVEEQLTRAFQNVLMVKDVYNTAASASPPAAIACAGVTIGLLVRLLLPQSMLSFNSESSVVCCASFRAT